MVLIAFEKGTVEELSRRPYVTWAHPVKNQLRGDRRNPPFTGVAEIHADGRADLDAALNDIHENFSHVEAYEF